MADPDFLRFPNSVNLRLALGSGAEVCGTGGGIDWSNREDTLLLLPNKPVSDFFERRVRPAEVPDIPSSFQSRNQENCRPETRRNKKMQESSKVQLQAVNLVTSVIG